MIDYDLERERINRNMDDRRVKEDTARRTNRDKQTKFRENMIRKGFRQKNVWVKDLPEDMIEVTAIIHKDAKGIADRNVDIGEKLKIAIGNLAFNEKIFNEELYSDIMLLLNPLGKIFQDPLYQGNPGYESGNA
jgi:hypothetical protein